MRGAEARSGHMLDRLAQTGVERLRAEDPVLFELLEQEHRRQAETLTLVAASSGADPSVLAAQSTPLGNLTTEGYPGARFHAGCAVADEIERLAIDRAQQAFRARYANVQPHSGTSANATVMFGVLRAGDTILGLDLDAGGHLTHGAKASISGRYFNAVGYGVTAEGLIDYDVVHRLARQHQPKLIICGASAYPRTLDFERFRAIADDVGALLMADISHIAGLVVAGAHPSPVDQAHFTTTSTYKQLYGPRGGLILIGRDYDEPAPDGKTSLAGLVQKAVFPLSQGTPNLSAVAAKARALAYVSTPSFRELARSIVADARALAERLGEHGYRLLTGGTDNHMVILNLAPDGLTGVVAERALEECNIVVNKNRIPGDKKPALITSGLRLGTNSVALRGMGTAEVVQCADLVHRVLSSVRALADADYHLEPGVRESVRAEVAEACARFPIPGYPRPPAIPDAPRGWAASAGRSGGPVARQASTAAVGPEPPASSSS